MNRINRVLTALGVIALSSTGVPAQAAPGSSEADYEKVCQWLSTQSADQLRDYIRQNPDSACVDVAAQLLAELSQPEAGVRSPLGGRY